MKEEGKQFFEDLGRMAGNAFGSLAGLRQEIEARVKEQFESFAGKLDMVRRDEFEAVKAMAAKARLEQEKLEKRIEELEEKLGKKTGGKK